MSLAMAAALIGQACWYESDPLGTNRARDKTPSFPKGAGLVHWIYWTIRICGVKPAFNSDVSYSRRSPAANRLDQLNRAAEISKSARRIPSNLTAHVMIIVGSGSYGRRHNPFS